MSSVLHALSVIAALAFGALLLWTVWLATWGGR